MYTLFIPNNCLCLKTATCSSLLNITQPSCRHHTILRGDCVRSPITFWTDIVYSEATKIIVEQWENTCVFPLRRLWWCKINRNMNVNYVCWGETEVKGNMEVLIWRRFVINSSNKFICKIYRVFTNGLFSFNRTIFGYVYMQQVQGGSNMTGTDFCVNKPHCAAAVRPWESEATTSTLSPARVRTCSVLSGSC